MPARTRALARRFGAILVLTFAISGCLQPPPSSADDPLASLLCDIAAQASLIPTELRNALDAAQSGDQLTAASHAKKARTAAQELLRLNGDPSVASDTELVRALSTLALFGDQAGFLFEGGVPSTSAREELERSLSLLDSPIAVLRNRLEAHSVANCWEP